MNVFFIKATYTNNVYKLSDFYTGTNYVQNANKKLDVLFKADDGITSLVTPISLPDSTDVRDYTHVIVPEQKKIYKIIATDYHNVNQYFITLDDDPLIANYQELKDKNIILRRSNDNTIFRGINDNASIVSEKEITVLNSNNVKPKIKMGAWALLFFQSDVVNVNIKFSGSNPTDYEYFATVSAMKTKYPELLNLYIPDAYHYINKRVTVVSTIYQCVAIAIGSNLFNLKWVKVPGYVGATVNLPVNPINRYKSNFSDLNMVVVALPIRSDIYFDYGGKEYYTPSYLDIEKITEVTSLVDVKIINDVLMDFQNVTMTSTTDTSKVKYNLLNGIYPATYDSGTSLNLGFITTSKFLNEIDVSYNSPITLTPVETPPFKKYILSVFGSRYEISQRYIKDLKLNLNVSSELINYNICYKNLNTIIASGSFTNQAKWSQDQLDKFYSMNPTYKEQFFLKMGIDSVSKIVGGAVAGSVVPGIGTIAGAVSGTIASGLDAGLSMVNLRMQEKSLSLQPDQLSGDNNDVSLQLANIFGIFWLFEKPTATGGYTEMITELNLTGFPTSLVKKITDLSASYNSLYSADVKIIYGETKEVVKNDYVTGYINNKLSTGIVII